jgi:hypothetical protein
MENITNLDKFNKNKFNQSWELIHYKLQQLGWQGPLGLLLLFISTFYFFMFTTPKASYVKQLHLDIGNIKTSSKVYAKDHNIAQFDVVKDFYRLLPAQHETNNKISVILNAATNAGLSLEKVEYDQPLTRSPIAQYQIKLPIKGSYVQIRQFVSEVLNNLPTIALDDISMRRDDITSDVLQARIQFTLYLKS